MKRELRFQYCGRKTAHQQRKNEDVVYNNTALRWNEGRVKKAARKVLSYSIWEWTFGKIKANIPLFICWNLLYYE